MAPEPLPPDVAGPLLASAPVGVALLVAPGTFAWANAAYFATTGRDPRMLGQDYHEILEEDGTWSAPIRAVPHS